MNKLYKDKFIPQNSVAEDTLLGIIFIYPNILYSIKTIIKKEYFFLETNQILYTYLIELNIQNSYNILQLIHKLKSKKILLKIGGINKIITLMKQGQTFVCSSRNSKNIKTLINILHENYIKRIIIQYGYNIINMGYLKKLTSKIIYIQALSQINQIEQEINLNKHKHIVNIKDLISQKLTEIKHQSINIKKNIFNKKVNFGFNEIDKIIYNLDKGNLIIIAGRPSIGKTSFAINLVYNTFFHQKHSILIFSLEMSNNELFNKIISIGLRIEINNKTINSLNKEQWHNISNICNRLLNNNIYISDQSNINIKDINNIAKNIKKKQEHINLIIIDYLQLIEFQIEKQKYYSRSQELGYITRKLKLLAQFLELPIITISQLNRNIETRSNKEPLLSDLKESGCIRYNSNITISCKYNYHINVKNIEKNNNLTKLKILNNKKKIEFRIPQNIQANKIISIFGYINLSHEYTFNYINKLQYLIMTHNHKYLSQNKWIESNKVLLSTTINYLKNKKHAFLLKQYIYQIKTNYYSKSYDINNNLYFSLIIKNIITHNSIEQDADIILTLYEQENKKANDTQIINIKIAKNRNGNTGYCKMRFIREISIFEDMYINIA